MDTLDSGSPRRSLDSSPATQPLLQAEVSPTDWTEVPIHQTTSQPYDSIDEAEKVKSTTKTPWRLPPTECLVGTALLSLGTILVFMSIQNTCEGGIAVCLRNFVFRVLFGLLGLLMLGLGTMLYWTALVQYRPVPVILRALGAGTATALVGTLYMVIFVAKPKWWDGSIWILLAIYVAFYAGAVDPASLSKEDPVEAEPKSSSQGY